MRILRGWGCVSESNWPRSGSWPPTEPPNLDEQAKPSQIFAYRRIRSVREAQEILAWGLPRACGFSAGFGIVTQDWYKAEKGVIPEPPSASLVDNAHAVWIGGYNNEKQQFKFMNCWGPSWGDDGNGWLSYQYFENFMTDAWVPYFMPPIYPPANDMPFVMVEWGTHFDRKELLYGIEGHEWAKKNRVAWSFARCVDVEAPLSGTVRPSAPGAGSDGTDG